VWDRDGKELGTVISLEPKTIVVKENGILGGEIAVPRTAVEEVETSRVDLSMTRNELKALS
jgi:hypothetical protein